MKVSTIHLCAASRPVIMTPLSNTGSPTLRLRMVSSLRGILRDRIFILHLFVFDSGVGDSHLAPAICPAHVTHTDKEAGWQAVEMGDPGAQQSRLSTKPHRHTPLWV